MRSLFAKLFLGAASIILLSMAIAVAIAVFSSSGPVSMHRKHIHSREKMLVQDILTLYARDALSALEAGNKTCKDLPTVDTATGFKGFLFTGDGLQIAGGDAPPQIYAMVKKLSPEDPAGIAKDSEMIVAAGTFTGSSGKRYVAAVFLPHPTDDPFEKRLPLPKDFWVRILVSFLLCGTICYAMARHLTIPIEKLRDATRNVAKGQFSTRVAPSMGKRKDEIADLAKDFDRMAERIENLVESQKRLLRDISHELRSPLARLTVALELAKQRSTEAAAANLERIGLETERLNDLIGQLLTLTMLESGSQRQAEEMDVSRIIERIASDARFEAQIRNVEVTTDLPGALPFTGHPEMVYRAVENVVRNALRYTADGTAVSISARPAGVENSWIEICVKDRGPGVPDSELANIFKPFYRIEDSRDRSLGGTGVGLAIAERAVKLHRGSLSVENAETGGLLVHIFLPLDHWK